MTPPASHQTTQADLAQIETMLMRLYRRTQAQTDSPYPILIPLLRMLIFLIRFARYLVNDSPDNASSNSNPQVLLDRAMFALEATLKAGVQFSDKPQAYKHIQWTRFDFPTPDTHLYRWEKTDITDQFISECARDAYLCRRWLREVYWTQPQDTVRWRDLVLYTRIWIRWRFDLRLKTPAARDIQWTRLTAGVMAASLAYVDELPIEYSSQSSIGATPVGANETPSTDSVANTSVLHIDEHNATDTDSQSLTGDRPNMPPTASASGDIDDSDTHVAIATGETKKASPTIGDDNATAEHDVTADDANLSASTAGD